MWFTSIWYISLHDACTPASRVDEINSVRTPLDFSIGKAGPKGPVPSLGEHTAEVLRASGVQESTVLAALASNNKVKAKL